MVVCDRCREEADDGVKCNACQKHYHFPCSGITEVGYRKLGDRQATWRCPACKTAGIQTPKQGVSPTPVTLEQVMQELMDLKLQLAPLSNLAKDINEMRTDISDLKVSSKASAKKIEKLEGKIKEVEKTQGDVAALKDRICSLEDDLNDKNQWLRLNNVEIKGVPIKNGENLIEIVTKIGAKITYPIAKSSINYVARVPSKQGDNSKDKPIIVSFLNRYAKEDFVAAARQLKTLCPADIGLQGSTRIYVNDHLTIQNKILLNKAKNLGKEYHFQFVWVKHAKIFVRKDPTSSVITIKTEKDLTKIH